MKTAIVLTTALAASWPGMASAGGLFVPGAGPQPQARAGAFTAKADDPSAMAHNPAGFAKLDGTNVTVGVNLVDYSLRYTRAGSYELSGRDEVWEGQPYPTVENEARPEFGIGRWQALPTLVLSTDLGHPEWPVRVGVGMVAPQGYPARAFPEAVDLGLSEPAPAPQRYDIIEQNGTVIAASVAVAYSPRPDLDVGVRGSWGVAETRGKSTSWTVLNYQEWPGREATTQVEGRDSSVPSFGLGVLYRPSGWLELGASYASAVKMRTVGSGTTELGGGVIETLETLPIPDADARCAPGGEVGAIKTCLDLQTPQMVTVGGRYVIRDTGGAERADVELDLRWEDWSAASDTEITVDGQINVSGDTYLPLTPSISRHGFGDVLSLRLGGAYSVPIARNQLVIRAGFAYDTAAAPDSWTRVDTDGKSRATIAAGVAYQTSRFRIDAGAGVSLEPTISVAACRPPDGPTAASPGCDGSGQETPVSQRTAPDPVQPLQDPLNQAESPFNAGRYESGYLLASLGFTVWF